MQPRQYFGGIVELELPELIVVPDINCQLSRRHLSDLLVVWEDVVESGVEG